MGFVDSETIDEMKDLKVEVLDHELVGACIVGRRPGASAGQDHKGRLC